MLGRPNQAFPGRVELTDHEWAAVCSLHALDLQPYAPSIASPQRCSDASLPSINAFDFTTRRMDIDAPCPRCPFCGLPMRFRFSEHSTLQTFDCNRCGVVLNIPPQADVLEIAAPALARG